MEPPHGKTFILLHAIRKQSATGESQNKCLKTSDPLSGLYQLDARAYDPDRGRSRRGGDGDDRDEVDVREDDWAASKIESAVHIGSPRWHICCNKVKRLSW